ncbi:MAG: heme exporter protein CcmB [Anaerolineales bacterium]
MQQDELTVPNAPLDKGASAVGFWRTVFAILGKDLTAEMRSRELLSSMFIFGVLVILIFNFAFELDVATRQTVTAGVLWVAFAFSGTLGLNRSMASEKDRASFDGLLLAPVDRSAIFFGKMLGNLLFMFIVEGIVIPIYSILYNTNLFSLGFLSVVVLGSIGYVSVGTLLATMAIQTRTRDVMLPILLFPVVIPLLIAAVKGCMGFLQGLEMDAIRPWLNLLIAYDVIFLALAWMVFDYLVAE